MGVIEGRTWLEVLTEDECWDLVSHEEIGRVALLVDGAPEIYPVNHAVDERAIVFRTDPGSKLRSLVQSPSVCFEVDGTDAASHQGWSVMVKGHATELKTGDAVTRAAALPLDHWAHGEKAHWIQINAATITGRRIYHPANAT